VVAGVRVVGGGVSNKVVRTLLAELYLRYTLHSGNK